MSGAFLLLVLLRPQGAAAEVVIDPRIFAGRPEGERAPFLIVLREQADLSGAAAIQDRAARRRFVYEALRAHAEATQTPLREWLDRSGARCRPHFLVSMIEAEGDRALALELASRGDVSSLESNRESRLARPALPDESRRAAAAGIEPNIDRVGAPELWARGFTGQGVVIGVADTGFQWDHPALRSQYRGSEGSAVSHDYNWHDAIHDAAAGNPCGSDAPAPCDDDGHGTSVAGLAVGDDGAGNRVGVAPGATLIGCRNMDRGTGTPARYTECFEWLLAPTDSSGGNARPDLGADAINNSWTCPANEGCTNPNVLRAVVENTRAAGVAVVAAAGNQGASCSTIGEVPAIYDAAITVGATSLEDAIAGFSSFGPVTADGSNRLKPDLVAPGVGVRTSMPSGGYLSTFSGTSAATPHVTGAIALLWSAVPGLAGDVDSTERLLEEEAAPLTYSIGCGGYSGADVPNPVFGWGRLDVEKAYARATGRSEPLRSGAGRRSPRTIPPRP